MLAIGTAWRDWDFIMQSTSTAVLDPFRITTHQELESTLIEEAGLLTAQMIRDAQEDVPGRPKLPLNLLKPLDRKYKCKLPGVPRHHKQREELIQMASERFLWGIGAGIALIAPMLLMVLHNTLLTTLIATSVSVIIFAFVVALISSGLIGMKAVDLGPKDVLATTAAYAAVLVVFVGVKS